MEKRILKYDVPFPDGVMSMSREAMFLDVQLQDGKPVMWFVVGVYQDLIRRKFKVLGTGQDMDEGLLYLGTWQEPPFVWHLHEDLRK